MQQDFVDQEIETEIINFLTEESLSTEEIKEAEVLSRWNLNKKKYFYFARFAKRYLSAPPFSVYFERIFSKTGNL